MPPTAGQKADATIVANLIRDRYSNPAKDAIRSWVVAELKLAKPTLILDLWGGGRSAEELVAAGLPVLSVDDGRGIPVSSARAKRALEIKAAAGGYRAGWGSAARYAPECDAAWLDFCGQWSAATGRLVHACRHMKRLVITLMPERTSLAEGRLPMDQWVYAMRGLIEGCSGRFVNATYRYRRDGGLWVFVFLVRARDPDHYGRSRRRTPDALWRERERRYQEPEEYRERRRTQRRARRIDPEYRAREAAQEKARRANPEYLARVKAREARYTAEARERYAIDAAYREHKCELQRIRRAADPEAARAYQRARRAARKVASIEQSA